MSLIDQLWQVPATPTQAAPLRPFKVFDGYATGYVQGNVRRFAERVAKGVRDLKFRHRFATGDANWKPTIVVHGNSGVSLGFAALMIEDFHIVLLRKDNDNSHGAPIEGPDGHVLSEYYILDDFVSSGDTIRRIVSKIHTLAGARGVEAPKCVGMLLYKRWGGDCTSVRTDEDGVINNIMLEE